MQPVRPSWRSIFADRLREARIAIGLSQRELGLRIGLDPDVVSSRVARYETANSEPDFETAGRLADALGVPLASLFADNHNLSEAMCLVANLSSQELEGLINSLRARAPAERR